MPTPFLGMRGSGDWTDNQVPQNWAQYILYEYPNGSAPLYAMTSMFRQETVDSYRFNWFSKSMPTQAGSVTNVYIDAALGTPYVYATHGPSGTGHGSAEGVVYAKVSASLAKEFNKGALAILRDSDELSVDTRGRVVDNYQNGSSSYVAIKLIQDDDGHTTSADYNLATVDRILRYGSGYPEGSNAPNSVMYDPDEYYNYVENFRNTLDMTLTGMATHLRTGDGYKEAKRECTELHSMDIENAAIWGYRYNGTGENGKPLRLSDGMIPFLERNNDDNIVDYKTDTDSDYAGKTWLQAGKKFLNNNITQVMKYVKNGELMAFCGDKALLAIQDLAEAYGDIQITPETKSYGLAVNTWHLPAGKIYLKSHPLFSHETTNQNLMVLFDPKNCKFCPLVGGGKNFRTKFEKNMQIPGQHSQVDGFSTKGGWKFYFENQFMVMRNVGEDNTQ